MDLNFVPVNRREINLGGPLHDEEILQLMRDLKGQVVRFVDIRVKIVLAPIFFKIVIFELDRLVHRHIDSTFFSGIIFCEGGLLNLHFFSLVSDISIDDPTFFGRILQELRVQNLGVDIF